MKLSDETKRLSVAAGGGVFAGVALTVLVSHVLGGSSSRRGEVTKVSEKSRGPAVQAGATLTVATSAPRHPSARIRIGHSAGAKILGLVPTGTVVKVVGDALDENGHRWYQVAVDGKSGWMHGDNLS